MTKQIKKEVDAMTVHKVETNINIYAIAGVFFGVLTLIAFIVV